MNDEIHYHISYNTKVGAFREGIDVPSGKGETAKRQSRHYLSLVRQRCSS
jgi:hypothetical protein